MAKLRILGPNGDTVTEWEPEVSDERIEKARKDFEKLKKEGLLLFEIPTKGAEAQQTKTFNPNVFEIVATRPIAGG